MVPPCVGRRVVQAAAGQKKDGMITQTTRQLTSAQREKEDLQEALAAAMAELATLRQLVSRISTGQTDKHTQKARNKRQQKSGGDIIEAPLHLRRLAPTAPREETREGMHEDAFSFFLKLDPRGSFGNFLMPTRGLRGGSFAASVQAAAGQEQGQEKDGMITKTTKQLASLQREKEDLQEALDAAKAKLTKLGQQVGPPLRHVQPPRPNV